MGGLSTIASGRCVTTADFTDGQAAHGTRAYTYIGPRRPALQPKAIIHGASDWSACRNGCPCLGLTMHT